MFSFKANCMDTREYQGDLSRILFLLLVVITIIYCIGS